jgi:hypothetical protein
MNSVHVCQIFLSQHWWLGTENKKNAMFAKAEKSFRVWQIFLDKANGRNKE